MNDELIVLARDLGEALLARGWRLACAESCTGGLIAAAVTEIAGSSAWFERGFVTYANEAKMELLGVRADTLARDGAVSEACVHEMVLGALSRSHADLAVAVSGIAGPSGGSAEKPVGTVVIGWADIVGGVNVARFHFDGDRAAVREQAAHYALRGLLQRLAPATDATDGLYLPEI
ncbi:nicotinamide-nucleotide amidase [Uliginosibacterium sp. H1]|uniref:nicotinamide-nucleotide amidase n=1 Tax=Uliginosibacterium sp. H1 TaxID=3114757 RepID=UPI002E17D914|nr:nicotinamide-nucleotide amidase [Uliginosibacterium sp. H1]